ncbi:ferredoxin [Nocardia sp. NPDC050697]|uniref:ferredoxin n=1 Tax=Nocardia sp. NPDC050697 TaxID=3155158 RepID=UPI0033DA5631
MNVWVDARRCQGHTLCAMIAPDHFVLDDIDGHASTTSPAVAAEGAERVRNAVRSCPEGAIVVDESSPNGSGPKGSFS